MGRSTRLVLVACAMLAAAFLLNPSAERHRNHIKEAMAERSPLAAMLGFGALTAFASNYHSVGLASYTSIHGRTISIGLLGMVFVLDAQQDP